MRQTNHLKTIPLFILALTFLFTGACKDKPTPKPRGYFRIDLPQKNYVKLDSIEAYSFEYASPAIISRPERHPDKKNFININYPQIKGKVHISYMNIENNLNQLMEDSRDLVYKHTVKADAIQERVYERPEDKVYGIMYEIGGNAASSVQFFMTDSTEHFIRGALYFNATPNKDSLAPLINYVTEDIEHLIETLHWK